MEEFFLGSNDMEMQRKYWRPGMSVDSYYPRLRTMSNHFNEQCGFNLAAENYNYYLNMLESRYNLFKLLIENRKVQWDEGTNKVFVCRCTWEDLIKVFVINRLLLLLTTKFTAQLYFNRVILCLVHTKNKESPNFKS